MTMDIKKMLNRIIIDPQIMAGKPIIKGTRLTVQHIVGLLAQGMTIDEIMSEHERLTREDVLACLTFAQQALENTTFTPLSKKL
jgi:uncharacterized protein (DUF433 family)